MHWSLSPLLALSWSVFPLLSCNHDNPCVQYHPMPAMFSAMSKVSEVARFPKASYLT